MYPVDLSSTEVRVTWRATLLKGSPWSSRHFAMAVIVNLMNVIQFWTMYKFHTGGHYWSAFIVVLAFVYAMLDYYAVLLYRQTRDWLKMLPEESKEAHQLLQLSYIGYRLYLVGMGTGFLVLSYFNLIRR
jgi:hypothetical protein